jgi:hypothetical protein
VVKSTVVSHNCRCLDCKGIGFSSRLLATA